MLSAMISGGDVSHSHMPRLTDFVSYLALFATSMQSLVSARCSPTCSYQGACDKAWSPTESEQGIDGEGRLSTSRGVALAQQRC